MLYVRYKDEVCMSLRDLDLKTEYRSLSDDVVNDFYLPVLKESILYQRAVGFFSSSALCQLANGIQGLVDNGGKIQIIASPKLSEDDIRDIKAGYEVRKAVQKALLRELTDPLADKQKEKLSFISKLIANNVMDIKIAFLSSGSDISMYHEKVGIMSDVDGNSIAFSGSMNESENAFHGNYESFDVFCSWTSDYNRVTQKQLAFNAIWGDYEPGLKTIEFPVAVKNKLLSYKPSEGFTKEAGDFEEAIPSELKKIYLPSDFTIRPYQESAINEWQKNNYTGIFDMATGTGKTLTALASIEHLYRHNNERLGIIIACPYQHLVEQWTEDIVRFGISPIVGYSSSKQKNWKKRLEQAVRSFNMDIIDTFCFVTTNATFSTKFVQDQISLLSNDAVFVVDEAHNMGSKNYQRLLPQNIPYRLALSATIDRHNDEEGTDAHKILLLPCVNLSK